MAIPSGSYIPEITWSPHPDSISNTTSASEAHPAEEKAVPVAVVAEPHAATEAPSGTKPASRGILWRLAIPITLIVSAISFWIGYRTNKTEVPAARVSILPWSAILRPGHTLQIVDSDPDFAAEQDITGHATTLAEYANGRYIPENSPISPELRSFAQKYLGGRKVGDIDVPIAVSIAALAGSVSESINIRSSRTLRLSDFHTDDDFVLLGSPLSDPWSDLFVDQLDFRFKFANDSSLQNIENVRPQGNELSLYSPVGRGFTGTGPATGISYGIVALVDNPSQAGRVLLIAGTGAEATEAAGHLVTNVSDLSTALRKCHTTSGEPLQHFEILLKIAIMGGSPSRSEVVACHALSSDNHTNK